MFGLRIVHKRELAMQAAMVEDLRTQILDLRKLVEHERARAEAAINLVLMKEAKAVLTPLDPLTLEQQEKFENAVNKKLDLFGDHQDMTAEEALDKLQS